MAKIRETDSAPKVKHYWGMPPEMTNGEDHREMLEWPAFLIIEEKEDGVFLIRYDKHGDFAGDTWHKSIDDAKIQADFEYGDLLYEWIVVPSEVEDAVAFAQEYDWKK